MVRYLRILVGRAEAGLPIWSTHAALAWELRDLFVRYRPLLEASFGPEEYGTLLARIRRATAIS